MSKFYFCSFASSDMKLALQRIGKQAQDLGEFSEIFLYTENELPQYAKQRVFEIIEKTQTRRGFGYWAWKPAIILDILDKINDGDYLMYCDAGCHINKNAKNKFFEYAKMVEKYNFHVAECTGYPDFEWSKMDLIDLLKPTQEQLKADQIMATHIFLIKNEYTYNLIKKWNQLMSIENLHYFDDSPSILPNADGFKENRHDQSVLSLLLKTSGIYATSPTSEFFPICFYKTIDMLNKHYRKKFKIPKEAYETAWEELNALILHKRDKGQKTKKGLQKFIEKLKNL